MKSVKKINTIILCNLYLLHQVLVSFFCFYYQSITIGGLIWFNAIIFTSWFLVSRSLETLRYIIYGAIVVSSAVLFVFLNNISIHPEWHGFTGPYSSGYGTDDSRYYVGVIGDNKILPDMAEPYVNLMASHPFTLFLKIIYPFKDPSPFDLVYVNSIALVVLPIVLVKVNLIIFGGMRSALLYWITLLNPIILSNGVILMREVWVALGISMFMMFALSPKIRMALPALISIILRPGSALIIYIIGLILAKSKIIKYIYLIAPVIILYIAAKSADVPDLLRIGFIEEFLYADSPDGFLQKIYTSKLYVRIPLGLFFFSFYPYLDFNIFIENYLNIRLFLLNILGFLIMLIVNSFVISYLCTTRAWKDIRYLKLALIYIMGLLFISQFSIQLRHLMMLYPLLMILFVNSFEKSPNRKILIFLGMVILSVNVLKILIF